MVVLLRRQQAALLVDVPPRNIDGLVVLEDAGTGSAGGLYMLYRL